MPVVLGAASAFTSRRVATYGALSTVAALAIVVNAFRQRSNFYSAMVMLGGSNGCMMVLLNFGVFLMLCLGKLCQKILFGPLRAVEVEHLHERMWYAITESLLAMTIFRDDFDSSFALLFGTLLFLKVFHWLSADRVEYMEQSPSVSRLFHVRMIAVLSMLLEFDLFLATFAVEVLIIDRNRKGIMIMFASEFFILGATLWSTIAKYLINCQDLRSEEPWQAKSIYVFFVDLITDFLKLATYVACFCLILSYYGLPLNIIRDVYMTGRSFFGRLRDFVKYRAATRNMDTRFPDASSTDLRSMSDGTCIICREEMVASDSPNAGDNEGAEGTIPGETPAENRPVPQPTSGLNETPKKLPCGHIFHFHCLRSWLERQQSCPTCRRSVFAATAEAAQMAGVPGVGIRGAAGAGAGQGVDSAGRTRPHEGAAGLQRPAGQGQAGATANSTQTARDRLHSFLQQLQNDAQRIREESQRHQEAHRRDATPDPNASTSRIGRSDTPGADTSNAGEPSRPTSDEDSVRSPARRMLINSLFANQDVLQGRRSRDQDTSSALLPPPLSQGLVGNQAGPDDSLRASWIPPAPWTLRARSRDHRSAQGSTSEAGQRAEPEAKRSREAGTVGSEEVKPGEGSSNTEKTGKDLPQEAEPSAGSADPVDAREAARAAALRRFEAQRTTKSGGLEAEAPKKVEVFASLKANTTIGSTSATGAQDSPQANQTSEPALIGDPRLIPLFDPRSIDDFTSHHAPRLPYPLLERRKAENEARISTLQSQDLASLALSAADLEGLSQRSRQGVEERLRLLYRVEGAVGNLVEELTRALSVMPADDVQPSESIVMNSEADLGAHVDNDSEELKGKAPAEGVHASL